MPGRVGRPDAPGSEDGCSDLPGLIAAALGAAFGEEFGDDVD